MTLLKKLIIAHSFPKDDSDFRGRFIVDYMRERKDEQFIVVAPHPENSFLHKEDNYEVHYFHWKYRLLGGMKIYNPFHHFLLIKMLIYFYLMSRKVLKTEPISSIFACWAIPGGLVARLLRLFHGVNYSVWLLGTDVNKFIKIPFLLRTICGNADTVFANSNDLKQKIGRVTDKEVSILLTRSALPEPQIPENGIVISHENINVAFVGRLEKVKGIDIFLSIAKEVKKSRNDISFYVFGDGSLSGSVSDADTNDIVRWAGQVVANELSYYADFIDIILITSRTESMPVVFWEFQDRATILSFPVGDITHHLDGDHIMKTKEDFIENIIEYEVKT